MANATVGVVTCVACPEGLRCPLGSSLESLKMGDKNFGEAFTPRILEGYFSTEDPCFEWTFSLKKKIVCLMLSVCISVEFGMTNGLTFRGTLCCEARRSCKCILGDDHKKS